MFGRLRPYLNKVYFVRDRERAIGSGELYVVSPNLELVDPNYLCHYLISDMTLFQTKWILSGNSYPRLDEDQFLDLLVIHPEKQDQEQIMKRISPTEDKISILEQQIDRLSMFGYEVFAEELGVDLDVYGVTDEYFFKTGEYKNSTYFPVLPDEVVDRLSFNYHDRKLKMLSALINKYSTTTLDNAVTMKRGEQPEYDDKGDVIAIKTVDLKNGFINYEECLRISRKFFESAPTAQLKKGDILVSSTGYVSMGKVDVFDYEKKEAIADGHISILRAKQGYDPLFIVCYLRSHFGKVQFERWWSGSSGQIELQITDLARFIIPDNSKSGIPPSRQEAIAKRISEIEKQISDLKVEKKIVSETVKREFLS